MTVALAGGCHCGRLRVALDTARPPIEISPRACDCDFCRKHGAAWISDSQGALRVDATEANDLLRYRQGSETADMLLCARCGVLIAVVFEHRDGLFGAVNAGCLDDATFAAPTVISPQRLSSSEKVERWRALWAPASIVLSQTYGSQERELAR